MTKSAAKKNIAKELSLQTGIQVYMDEGILSQNKRVELSSGILRAGNLVQGDFPYCQNAYIPKEPWRTVSPTELNQLVTRAIPRVPGTWVGLMRIPDQFFSGLEQIGLGKEGIETILGHRNYRYAIGTVVDYLKLFYDSDADLVVHNIASNPPGLVTVTYNSDRNCYIGLHLDSWDRLPFDRTHLARNRICINFGLEDRYLLFFNLTLLDMFNILEISLEELRERQKDKGDERAIAHEFMRVYPSYPVIRLRIEPREAYIAPTENMWHDGSSIGQKHQDIYLTLRGYFSMR